MLSQSTRGCRSRAVTGMDAKLPGQRHEQPHAGRKSRPNPSCQPHVRECRDILGHALFPGSYSHLWERAASVCGECVWRVCVRCFTWSLEVDASHLHRVCGVMGGDVCVVQQALCSRLRLFSFATGEQPGDKKKKITFQYTRTWMGN